MVLSLSPASTSSLVSSISDLADRVDRLLSQPTAKLAMTAAAASAVTLASVLGTQAFQRRRRARRLKRDVLSSAFLNPSASDLKNLVPTDTNAPAANGGPASTASPIELSPDEESLVQEQLSRNISFLGQPGARKVRNSFVIVVGCGGVGSWAALMLLRSGVERIRVIDFDQVTLSSLNRHAVATRADVGVPKVNALKRHAREIVPHAVVDARVELFDNEAAERLLDGNPDYVLDCIDNMKTKLDLLKFCHDKKLPVISSMGAGAKADPSRVQIADISETFEDPLARTTRRSLRKMGVENGIDVVYSTEKPGAVKLMPLDESQRENAEDFAALPTFRVRILPVLGTLPAIFGMSMASYVLLKLANFPVEPLAVKLREGLYTRLFRDLRHREANVYKATEMRVDVRDVGYIYEEIFRGRSAVSRITEKLALTRWDPRKPFTLQNCVVLTKNEADFHDKLETAPEEHYSASIVEYVRCRFREEAAISKIRD